jgi:ribosomal protein S18 acetylase RimI-like enzyme
MRVTFTELGPAEFRRAIREFVAVYAAAMNPPDRMLTGRDAILDRHAANPGFRALAAFAEAAELAGFTYGFHGAPGQWWHDTVAGALALTPGRPTVNARDGVTGGRGWLEDSFEVAELHVVPDRQGMGIGRELLLRLTTDRIERTAVLSTADTESRARRLYRRVGFTDLLTGFRFAGGEPPYAVMGAALPLLRSDWEAPGSRSPRSPSPRSW